MSWYTHKGTFVFIAYLQEDIHTMAYSQSDIRIMAYSQGDIGIHCIPKRAFAFIASPQGGICIMAYLHGHSHHGIPTRAHLHHDIAYRRGICIMTYPLEGICITRHWHLHFCKETTFASRLNMCAGTIMDKLYIRTPTWDICIKKIAFLKRDICIILTFRICILVKSIWIENENLDLHNILFAFIESWHLDQWLRVC